MNTFKLLTENSFDIVNILRADGTIVFESNATKRILGYNAGERVGKNAFEFVHPEDIQHIIDEFQSMVSQPNSIKVVEYRFKHHDGSWRWLQTSGQNFLSNPHVNGIIINSRDITESKKISDELIKAKEKVDENKIKFESYFNFAPDGVFITDEKGNYVEVNPVAALTTGYSLEELCRKNIIDILPETEHEFAKEQLTNLLINGKCSCELHFQKKDKTIGFWIVNAIKLTENRYLAFTKEITERKSVEKALKDSEEKYRVLSENTTDGVSLYEGDKIVYVSEGYLSMLGYERHEIEEINFEQIFSFIHPDDINRILENIKNAHSHQDKKFQYTYRVRNKKGEYIWAEDNINAEYDNDGNHVRSVIHSRDISDRKNTEQIIIQLNNRLETSLIAGNLAWWELYLPKGDVIFNENKAKMLGYEADKFKHYSDFMNIVHPDDSEPTMKAMQDHIYGEKPTYDCEYRIKNSTGEYLWFYDIGRIVENKNGNIILNGIVQDITERKQTEFLIKESEERLKLSVNAAKAGVWDWDYKTGELKFNSYFYEMIGFSENEFGNNLQAFVQLVHPADVEMINTEFNNLFSKQTEIFRAEYRMKTKNNNWKWILTYGEVVQWNQQGKQERITGISIDIDELKTLQVKLQELNLTKDKFFSIIAHDLKNPFNSLLGFSELLVKNATKYTPEKVQQFAQTMNSSAKNAYQLLENLLEWSRIQTGIIEPKPMKLKPSDLIYEVKILCDPIAKSKNIDLQLENNCDDFILADKEMTKTVLRNIITNAIKFTNPEGYVKIITQKTDKSVLFTVSDNGIGIEPEHIGKLFRIDSKLSKTGTAQEKGTGLGLILCKEFVEKNNGKIWVDSEFGKGSEFKFTVPFYND